MTDAGIARASGLAVSGATAAIVIAIGLALFPAGRKQELPPAPPVVAPTPPAPPPTPAVADASALASAPAGEAGTAATKAADAGSTGSAADAARAANPEKAAAAEPEPAKPAEEMEATAASSAAKAIDKQKQADKDLAREAWRRNRPDIGIVGTKTAILIPIKGSIKGADFKISDKRRLVTVTLPKAVSMVTMRVYTLKHPSFKKLWIDQDEANAQPGDGTKLRLILSQTLDPQVEITEDFVRVTIRRPDADDSSSEKSERRAERRREKRAEKAAEPADEPAPEKEKEKEKE